MPKPARGKTVSVHKPAKKSHYIWLAIFGAAVVTIIAVAAFGLGESKPKTSSQLSCGPYRDDRAVTINGHAFKAEAPNNQAEFNKGLGGRPCILPNEAMIFPFTKPGQYAFWMKDMKFPIDIIWINSDHEVVANKINLQPSSYPNSFQNPQNLPAQYVLEIKANLSNQLKIGLGTVVYF